LNPGDLSWEGFEQFGECVIHNRTPPDKILERASGSEIVLTNKTPLDTEVLNRLPGLKYIGVLATGYNVVDIRAARDLGIVVTNIPAYGTASVAQMVFAHILNLTQRVADHSNSVKSGKWAENPDFCYWEHPLIELSGTTLGIIGAGRIGLETARLGLAFGMSVLAHDIHLPPSPLENVEFVELDYLLKNSDVVSLHCPLTDQTERLINEEKLSLMKSSAFLINTSRGPLVDEDALARSLNMNRIAGAGMDVLSQEPPDRNNPLYRAKNCFITPHIAWATKSARNRLMQTAIDNLNAYLSGHPQNQVNN
jgi:glycerate dehydrogenase